MIAGDLSQEDVDRAETGTFPVSDITEFIYDENTVYFAQPTLPQFVPGGSGAGAFNANRSVPISLKDTTNSTFSLPGKNAPKNNIGVVLRYALPVC